MYIADTPVCKKTCKELQRICNVQAADPTNSWKQLGREYWTGILQKYYTKRDYL